MSGSRTKGRRSSSRAFRPALDGQLEDRVLLSTQTLHQYLGTQPGLLKHPQAGVAFHVNVPPFLASDAPPFQRGFRVIHAAASQTIRGGQAVNVAAVDGSHYRIQLSYIPNTVQTSAQGGLGGSSPRPLLPHSFTRIHFPNRLAPSGSMQCRMAWSVSSWMARPRTPS